MGRSLTLGYDAQYGTWFAQLYAEGEVDRDCPVAVMGFTVEERAAAFSGQPEVVREHVPSFRELQLQMFVSWGIRLADWPELPTALRS
jgi:hypothetical protein